MKKLILTLFLYFVALQNNSVYSQGVELLRNNRIKTIEYGSLVELYYSENHISDKINYDCCNYKKVLGRLEDVRGDSLIINVVELLEVVKLDSARFENQSFYSSNQFNLSIAKKDVFQMIHHKAEGRNKTRRTMSAVGGLLLFTGAVSATTASIVSGKENKQKALLFGAIQVGVGITMAILFRNRKYSLAHNQPKSWTLK